MAEAVGVVIGVAGLAGVLNACLEALSLFHAGQTFGRDLEILLTKLDIEKTLLLHWAERIGLAAFQDGRSTHDTRLNDPRTYTAVVNTLSSVLYLLTDSEQLRSRYGAIQSSEITCIQKIDIVSSNRMVNFVRSYQQRLAKIGKRQDDSKAWTRAKWAIRDKDKFYTLVKELGDFIRYLNELLPGQDHQQRLIHEDINRIARDVRSLRLVQQATVQDYRDWADAASSYAGMSDLCSEELQRIEDWRDDIPNFLGEGPTFPPGIKQENSTREKDPEGFPEAAIGPPLLPGVKQENFTREKDPEDFRKAAIGPTEALVQLCQSNKYTVRRTDNNGHTLLRYALEANHIENVRVLLRYGSDVNSHEPLSGNHAPYVSLLNFMIFEAEKSFPPRSNSNAPLLSESKQMQELLLDYGADPLRPCVGSSLDGDVPFDKFICSGSLQSLLPLYLSKRPEMDLERVASNSEYTPLLHVCQSLYDPYGNKLDAVRLLIEKGANTRAVCRTFAYSSLHLILLSTRDEVYHLDGELWKGNSEDLREALVLLVRGEADIGAQNKWALTPSDLAIGLKCVPSWNDAMYECGFPEHAVDDSFDANPFGQDLVKQAVFEKFWEDYNHFSRWDCKPNSCFRGCYRQWRGSREDQCPWWDDYEFNWLPHWKWNLMYDDWEEL